MLQVVDVLTRTEAYLRERGIDSPRLEAELMLSHVLGMERLQLYLAFDRPIAHEERERLRELVARRGKREPLAWILGTQAFHTIELVVRPGVLVPRPDTETLVNAALEWIPADLDPVYVADVGCGSGAVGLAIAANHPGVRLYATDIAPIPLETTRENVALLGLAQRVAVLEGSLLDPIPNNRPVEWVVSNPPYIASLEIDDLQPEVARWEPRGALDGGPDGLGVYRALLPRAARRATRGVLVEIGMGQGPEVIDLMRRAGLEGIETWSDLGGRTRVVGGLVSKGS